MTSLQAKLIYLMGPVSRAAGGMLDAVRNLALAVRRRQCYELSVVGLEDPETRRDKSLWGKIETKAMPVRGPRTFGYAPQMYTTLQAEDPDLLHVHGLWIYTSVAAIRWARRQRPYVVSPHGMLDPWALDNSRLKKRISAALYENRHLRGAACLHALNDAEAEAIRGYGLKNPVCVIPNGVELPVEANAKRSPGQNRNLLYLGRLHPKKGLPLLVEAWCRIRHMAEESGWSLVIAGWDQLGHQSDLQALAAKLHADSRIDFVGPRFGEEKSAAFREASAFILPSLSEGLPMSVLEAWSWRLPVLMTTNCNLPEGSKAGAAIVMEADIDDICQALIKLFHMDNVELESVGARGRRLVEGKFQWPHIAQQMTQVYDWLLGRASQPSCIRH
jgi:glycosyltransferase involved in cell wall biosynthesis